MLASGFANFTGHPSLNLPCDEIDGLPFGVQPTCLSAATGDLWKSRRPANVSRAGPEVRPRPQADDWARSISSVVAIVRQ
jgi:hypothetical protein